MIISNDSRDSNDPKELDDPQLFDDQLEVWTLIIQESTVIPSSPMVLFYDEISKFEFSKCTQSRISLRSGTKRGSLLMASATKCKTLLVECYHKK